MLLLSMANNLSGTFGSLQNHTQTGNIVVSTSATLSSCDLGAAGAGKLGSIGALEVPACAWTHWCLQHTYVGVGSHLIISRELWLQ